MQNSQKLYVRTRNFLPQLSKVFPTPPAARRELVTHDAHHSEIAFDRALDSDKGVLLTA